MNSSHVSPIALFLTFFTFCSVFLLVQYRIVFEILPQSPTNLQSNSLPDIPIIDLNESSKYLVKYLFPSNYNHHSNKISHFEMFEGMKRCDWNFVSDYIYNYLSNIRTTTDSDLKKFINLQGPKGVSLLSIASANCDIGTVQKIVSIGANVNHIDSFQSSPLFYAIENSNPLIIEDPSLSPRSLPDQRLSLVQLLLDSGANLYHMDHRNRTALWFAVQSETPEIVDLLLRRGLRFPLNYLQPESDPVPVPPLKSTSLPSITTSGSSLLMDAVSRGSLEMTRLLLRHGANLHPRTEDGFTLLHKIASQKKSSNNFPDQIVRRFPRNSSQLKKKENIEESDAELEEEEEAVEGSSLLMNLILSQGKIDVNALTHRQKYSALLLAARSGNLPSIQSLLFFHKLTLTKRRQQEQEQEEKRLQSPRTRTRTPPMLFPPSLNLLDLNYQLPSDGASALFMASYQGFDEIVFRLLMAGANPDLRIHDGRTSLFIAVQESKYPTLSALIHAGADPNIPAVTAQKKETETHSRSSSSPSSPSVSDQKLFISTPPLFYAITQNDTQAVKLLLHAGKDKNQKLLTGARKEREIPVDLIYRNEIGYTALDLAKEEEGKKVIQRMIEEEMRARYRK